MNKQIRKIESQAWAQVTRTNGLVRTEDFNQKFAELIIQECAKIAKKEQVYNDGHEIHVNIDQCILIEFGL
jgi:hypothetical protein